MKKKSRRKKRHSPTAKAKKPCAVPPAGKAARSKKDASAHQKAPLPTLPLPHGTLVGDVWTHFELTGRMLLGCSESAPETLNSASLAAVMLACVHMLRMNLRVGGEEARQAAVILRRVTHKGCEELADAAADEKSREVLKEFASAAPVWPVLLSPKKSSTQEAQKYLRAIGVGTASTLPTAKKVSPNSIWTIIAVELIEQINLYRTVLLLADRKKLPESGKPPWESHRAHKLLLEKKLPEANAWKQVLNLPQSFTTRTRQEWWAVAVAMLGARWKADPDEAKELFKSVEGSATTDVKTPQGYATRAVKRAFDAIAAPIIDRQGEQDADSIPSA